MLKSIKRHQEELILQLACSPELHEAQLYSITQRLNISPELPRIACIVKVDAFTKEQLSLAHLQKIVYLLEYPERDNIVAYESAVGLMIAFLSTLMFGVFGFFV